MRRVIALIVAFWLVSSARAQQTGGDVGTGGGSATAPASADSGKPSRAAWVNVTRKAAFSPRDTAEDLIFAGRFSPRHEPTCYVYSDSLWVVAGNSWPVQNDVWRLTLPPSAKSRDDKASVGK